MNLTLIGIFLAVAAFGYVAWAITSFNRKAEKEKELARKNNENLARAQRNAEVLRAYSSASSVIRDNLEDLKKEVANAQSDEEVLSVINSVVLANNQRVQNNNNNSAE